jgi:hypothetical protein
MSEKSKKYIETTLAVGLGGALLAGVSYAGMKEVEAHRVPQPTPIEQSNPQHVGAPLGPEVVQQSNGNVDVNLGHGKVTVPALSEKSR